MRSRSLLDAIKTDRWTARVRTDHYAYSDVTVAEYPRAVIASVASTGGIAFEAMPAYFGQIDQLDQFIVSRDLHIVDDTARVWLYYNDPAQPDHPSGNPVREPFHFEVGAVVADDAPEHTAPSPAAGRFAVRELPAAHVASITYIGSYPHQADSGFVEACTTLTRVVAERGLVPTRRLYRELYHVIDWDDPSRSITQIQLEIEPP